MLVFAHTEKTAGKTVLSLLRRHYGTAQCELYNHSRLMRDSDLKLIRRFYPTLRCLAGHACMPTTFMGQIPDARFFTFVREPLHRAASSYQYGLHRGREMPSFEDWVARTSNYVVRVLAGEPNADRAIEMMDRLMGFVGLFESFDESLVLLQHWMQEPGFEIRYRRANVAPDNTVKKEILSNPDKCELLTEWNQEDLKLYAYVRDHLYPAQREAYGPKLVEATEAFKASLAAYEPARGAGTLGRAKRNLLFRPLWRELVRRRQMSPETPYVPLAPAPA